MPAKKTTIKPAQDFSFLDIQVSPDLIAQAIYVYQANAHRGVSKAKTRGEMDRSTRKIYKQKGTGNARHGARSAPIFVGGGITFGPNGQNTPLKSLNKKMRLRSLAGILSLYNKEDRLALIDPASVKDLSTKKALKLFPKDVEKENYGLVHFGESKEFLKSSGNVTGLSLLSAARLNTFKVAQNKKLLITTSALEFLKNRLSKVQSNKK